MKRFIVLCAVLALAACNPPPLDPVAVSGPVDRPVEDTTVRVAALDGGPVAFPTTTVPPTTHTHPTTTTTAPVVPATVAPAVTYTGDLHPAIAVAFGTGELGWQAQRVAQCESQLNPSAKSPTNDHGLFQLHAGSAGFPGGWVETFEDVTGLPFFDGAYDPNANAQFARWLYGQSGWRPWACGGAA